LAATSTGRKRRRKAPPDPSGNPSQQDDPSPVPTANGAALSDIVAEAALGLSVTDEDLRRRKELRRKRLTRQKKMIEEDPIRNLIDKGDDPDFFGFPFIWIQISHFVLGATAVAAAVAGGQGIEFALFNLEGETLAALRTAVTITITMNVFVAGWLLYEELQLGSERVLSGIGWALKALVIGGVASWQRWGRISKAAKKEAATPFA